MSEDIISHTDAITNLLSCLASDLGEFREDRQNGEVVNPKKMDAFVRQTLQSFHDQVNAIAEIDLNTPGHEKNKPISRWCRNPY